MRYGDFGSVVIAQTEHWLRMDRLRMERTKKNAGAEALLDRLWAEVKKEALDGKGVFGKYGVLFVMHDDMLFNAEKQSVATFKMPKVNQQA